MAAAMERRASVVAMAESRRRGGDGDVLWRRTERATASS